MRRFAHYGEGVLSRESGHVRERTLRGLRVNLGVLRVLLLLLFVAAPFCAKAHAQAAAPSTAPAPGTVASAGAPTIANPPAGPAQPVAFSHKKHIAEAKMGCNDCHEPSRNGATLAMPQPGKCMLCHAAIATDKPDIQRIAAAAKANEPLQWVRIYRVPSFVQFSHKTHTDSGAKCEDCHGPVAEREVMAKEKDLSMGGCIACHTAKSAPTGCDTCHELQSFQRREPGAVTDEELVARLARPEGPAVSVLAIHRFLAALALPSSSVFAP